MALFRKNMLVLSTLTCVLFVQAAMLSMEAGLLKPKPKGPDAAEQVRTFQPPPPNTMETDCEPFRKKAAILTQAPFWQKPFVWPERNLAIHRHRKCVTNLMMQEREYLKHADIQRSPSLPKLRLDETKPSPESPANPEPENAARP